jgi:ClpP class serine protease
MRRRYDRQGILALYPQAFLSLLVESEASPTTTVDGNAVIPIRGPLVHHKLSPQACAELGWSDSYEAILERVTSACTGPESTIILKIDSPGGELFGCFDAAHAIRARCKAAGKRLVAYVEGCACSAAYALACAADEIVISKTAYAGSIGILITRVDLTVRDAAEGVGFALVASGKRKADGHVHAMLTTPEIEAMQGQCNALAELFYELVASLRVVVTTDAVRALEADIFHGPRAVAVGLANRVSSFDALLEQLKKGPVMPAEDDKQTEEPTSSSKDIDDARAALERAAAEGNEKAQLALAALAEDPPPDDEEKDDDEPEAAASARGAGSSVSASSAADLAATVKAQGARLAKLEREKDSIELKALLASRADLGKPLAAHLASMPLADAKAIVDKMPKPAAPNKADKAAGTVVNATRGDTQVDPTTAPPSAAKSADDKAFDRAFGGALGTATGVKREGTSLIFDAAGAARARQQSANRQNTPRTVGEKGAAE